MFNFESRNCEKFQVQREIPMTQFVLMRVAMKLLRSTVRYAKRYHRKCTAAMFIQILLSQYWYEKSWSAM